MVWGIEKCPGRHPLGESERAAGGVNVENSVAAAAAAKSFQSCLTLWDSMPDSSVHGILQARILEWVAISFSRDLPDPGIEPWSPALQADSLPSEPPVKLHDE